MNLRSFVIPLVSFFFWKPLKNHRWVFFILVNNRRQMPWKTIFYFKRRFLFIYCLSQYFNYDFNGTHGHWSVVFDQWALISACWSTVMRNCIIMTLLLCQQTIWGHCHARKMRPLPIQHFPDGMVWWINIWQKFTVFIIPSITNTVSNHDSFYLWL